MSIPKVEPSRENERFSSQLVDSLTEGTFGPYLVTQVESGSAQKVLARIFHDDSSQGTMQSDGDKEEDGLQRGLYVSCRPRSNSSLMQDASASRKDQQDCHEIFKLGSRVAQMPPRVESFCEESEEDVFKTVDMVDVLEKERDPQLVSPEFLWFHIADTALQSKNLNADIRIDAQGNSIVVDKKTKSLEELSLPNRQETLENLQTHFRFYFFSTVKRMGEEIGLKPRTSTYETFQEEAEELYFKGFYSFFEKGNDDQLSTSHLIQLLHRQALQSLFILKAKFASPAKVPQIYRFKNKEGKEEWSVIEPAPSIENIALSGGGVRGMVYPCVLRAMKKAGTLDALKNIAGSSAGALSGAALACGLSIEKIESLSRFSAQEALQASEKPVSQQFSNIGFFEGTRIPRLIEQEGIKIIRDFIENKTREYFKKSDLTLGEQEKLKALLKIEKELNNKPIITFGHLATLHQINPSQFKNLIVTGYNSRTQSIEYYNAETTPEMSVAEAVRISISLPFIFKSPLNQKGETLYDGALFGSKTPVEVFSDEQLEKTVMLEFDNKGKFNKIVHTPEKINFSISKHISNTLASLLIGANPNEVTNRAREKLYKKGPGALNVYHGQLSGENFFVEPKKIEEAQLQAETRTWEWLALRQHQAIHTVTEDLHQYLSFKSNQELEKIIAAYQPQESDSQEQAGEKKEIVAAAKTILEEKAEITRAR